MGERLQVTAASAAVLLLVVAGCGGKRTSWTFTDAQPPVPVSGGLAGSLAPSVQRHAVALALRDDFVRRHAPRLVGAAPWTQGAALEFALARPVEVDADLPQADIPPDAPTNGTCARPYRQTWLHERGHGVTRLYVLVDLHRKAVADITTNGSGTLSWVPGKPHPDCQEIASG